MSAHPYGDLNVLVESGQWTDHLPADDDHLVAATPGPPNGIHEPGSLNEWARLSCDPVPAAAAFEAMPAPAIALRGPDHTVVAANAACRALLARCDMVGQPLRQLLPAAVEDKLSPVLDQVSATRRPQRLSDVRFYMAGSRGGRHERVVTGTVMPCQWPDGTDRGLVVTLVDVTARMRAKGAAAKRARAVERPYRVARETVRELQQALLPAELPILPGVCVSAGWVGAGTGQTAGKGWFDAVPLPDGRVALILGDVDGHGLAASAVMGQMRAVLHELLLAGDDLASVVERLDRLVARTTAITAASLCLTVLDPIFGALDYVTNGHPPPLIIDDSGAARNLPDSGGTPLGTGGTCVIAADTLRAGEILLECSAGLVKRSGHQIQDGTDVLARVAGQAARTLPNHSPGAITDGICRHVIGALARTACQEEVAMLAVQRRCVPFGPLTVEVSVGTGDIDEFRTALVRWLAGLDTPQHHVEALELKVTELAGNALMHRSAKPEDRIRMTARLSVDGVLDLSIADICGKTPIFHYRLGRAALLETDPG